MTKAESLLNLFERKLSRSKLINMPISDFLKMARAGSADYKEERVAAMISQGKKFSIPSLQFSNHGKIARIEGHEGRHRAKALQALGYTHMPVEFLSSGGPGGSIRWGRQRDKKSIDYIKVWPEKLVSEDGDEEIPFPVKRGD